MAIAPNTTFVSGAVLTAAQQNAFGFGVVALAKSTAAYTLTTSAAISTGMTVTFTAIANRNYKITYIEPTVQTPNTISGYAVTAIKPTDAAGTTLINGILQTPVAVQLNGTITLVYIGTFTAGSTTIVGTSLASSTSAGPTLARVATSPAFLLVEDIGPA